MWTYWVAVANLTNSYTTNNSGISAIQVPQTQDPQLNVFLQELKDQVVQEFAEVNTGNTIINNYQTVINNPVSNVTPNSNVIVSQDRLIPRRYLSIRFADDVNGTNFSQRILPTSRYWLTYNSDPDAAGNPTTSNTFGDYISISTLDGFTNNKTLYYQIRPGRFTRFSVQDANIANTSLINQTGWYSYDSWNTTTQQLTRNPYITLDLDIASVSQVGEQGNVFANPITPTNNAVNFIFGTKPGFVSAAGFPTPDPVASLFNQQGNLLSLEVNNCYSFLSRSNTLIVAGGTTLLTGPTITRAVTTTGDVSVTGNVTVSRNLSIGGTFTAANLTATQNVTAGANIYVGGSGTANATTTDGYRWLNIFVPDSGSSLFASGGIAGNGWIQWGNFEPGNANGWMRINNRGEILCNTYRDLNSQQLALVYASAAPATRAFTNEYVPILLANGATRYLQLYN